MNEIVSPALANPVLVNPVLVNPLAQECLRHLLRVWFEFERRLNQVPILKRLQSNNFCNEDYQNLLRHLRQQVIEGSRWIARSASSFDRDFSDVRSLIISHAADEHRDYEMLERDYVAAGGIAEDIRSARRNPGSEALHGFLMYRASQPNPGDMLGAMWIIEGLGEKMASEWASRIAEQIDAGNSATNFMRYHGGNDDAHMNKLYRLLDRLCSGQSEVDDIVRTATVVARLYVMQLEEIENDYAA